MTDTRKLGVEPFFPLPQPTTQVFAAKERKFWVSRGVSIRNAGFTLEKRPRTSEMPLRTHFYRDVPRLGHGAVSRHARREMDAEGIRQEDFERVLLEPIRPDIPDGQDILWRQRDGLRIVVHTNPTPNTGAKLVLTVYKVESQAVI